MRTGVVGKVAEYMQAGAAGIIFGRNLWQRPFDQALALTRQVHGVLSGFGQEP